MFDREALEELSKEGVTLVSHLDLLLLAMGLDNIFELIIDDKDEISLVQFEDIVGFTGY